MKNDSSSSTRTSPPKPDSGCFNLIAGLFVATLLISNTVAAKPWQLGSFVFPGGAILFPISYLFGDVLTEVYGYACARQVIWTGFAANALMALTYWIVIRLPPAPFWANQIAFNQILGQVPRIVLASFVAYLVGEFANSFVLAKMKIRTKGRHLWARTIGSTIVGQALDTATFVVIGFAFSWPAKYLAVTATSLYVFKVLYEIVATPATYVVVRFLKEKDRTDFYDVETNFSPFHWNR
jgi:queuosine precursor transporter